MKLPVESFLEAINITSDIIFFTTAEGNITYVNPAFEKITGYSSHEVIGKNPRLFHSGEHPKEFYEFLWNTILSGKPFRGVLKNRKKDGTIFYEEKTITPVLNGEITHFISSGKDVTERIEYDLKLEKLNKELEINNKELENYSKVVAHDLKNPLTVISLYISLLEQNKVIINDKEILKIIKTLKQKTKLMDNLIHDLLEYSRIGYEAEKIENVNVFQLISEMTKEIGSPKKIKFKLKGNWPNLNLNRLNLTQVFQNLISNAVKYMDKSEGIITLDCKEMKDQWKFSIADNGPGIEEKYFKKLFQPFQKAHTRKDIDSTGIGLSIVKKIIEKMGGKVSFESLFGKGSTFYFIIPKS